jgi:beta-glucosidase
MFATGIENSSPTIKNGRERVDEMEKCGHYKLWSADFDCVQEIGLCFLRYGIPLHRVFLGPVDTTGPSPT